MQQTQPLPSSFRDPSGFVFEKDGSLYRQVNDVFKEDFDHFINSGCCDHLIKKGLLIPHQELNENLSGIAHCYKTLKPLRIPFISYPYEWGFDMLKDAALLTLQLVEECIPFGVMLKDATPYNIQWLDGRLVFIDSLSFEKYDASRPWIAYRQFCETFLSPLSLMRFSKQPLQSMMLAWPDGIPIATTKTLLPWRSRFFFYTFLHIHLHERFSAASRPSYNPKTQFTEKKLSNLISSLKSMIQSSEWKGKATTWENYYSEASQRSNYLEQKKNIISLWLDELPGIRSAIDLGANEGEFSLLLTKKNLPDGRQGIQTISCDFDHSAINNLYKKIKAEKIKNILPLVIDLSYPSPAIGLNNKERSSFIERVKVDLALALALVHHLAIGKNIPFDKIAELFASITNNLVIEFVPKEDEKVQFMLKQKKDIYSDYTEENFTNSFEKYFSVLKNQVIAGSGRTLYLMKKT
jgi:ribosomal protein L11 methylase PrmA